MEGPGGSGESGGRIAADEVRVSDERTITSPDGCEHASTCLKCPLPDCVLGHSAGVRTVKLAERRREAMAMARHGKSTREIGATMGCGLRTVARYLRER